MSRSRWCLVALASLAPFSVQVHTQGDTIATVTAANGTRFEILTGAGDYAFITRGCNGTVLSSIPGSFRDAGARFEQDVGHGIVLGVRGGLVHDDIAAPPPIPIGVTPIPGTDLPGRIVRDNTHVNPYLTFEQEAGSVGLGWVHHEHAFVTTGEGARTQRDHPLNDMSAHIRFGAERHYFAIRWMEGVPIASSGGYLQMGMGGRPGGGRVLLYGGLGAGGPYEGAGLMFNGAYQFHSGITTSVRTRLGYSGNQGASGVAVGVGYGVFAP